MAERRGGGGGYLENPPEQISHAAEPGQNVTDEKGPGGAAAAQDDQAPGQGLCSRELRSNISVQRLDLRSTATPLGGEAPPERT